MIAASAASGSVQISPRAKCRKPLSPHRRGRLPKAPATGRWWAAPSHPVLILRCSRWRQRIGLQRFDREGEQSKARPPKLIGGETDGGHGARSEEHTSELQSRQYI